MAIYQLDLWTKAQKLKKDMGFSTYLKNKRFPGSGILLYNTGHQVEDVPHKLGTEDIRIMPFFHH